MVEGPDAPGMTGRHYFPLARRLSPAALGARPYSLGFATLAFFAASFAYHFLNAGFSNDHYDRISRGWQVLTLGEAPHRDFFDPGYLLTLYSSAAVQAIFGHNLLGEAILTVLYITLGLTLAFFLAVRASRSLIIASIVMVLAVATETRFYSYDKVLFYVLGVFLCWRYADRPTRANLVLLGAVTTLAFLYRYDNALYIGCGVITLLLTLHWGNLRTLLYQASFYGFIVMVSLLPFFGYLQLNGVLIPYFDQAATYAIREGQRTRIFSLPPITVDWSAPLVEFSDALPLPETRLKVRWAESVTRELRTDLQARYGLQTPEFDSGRTWSYTIHDASADNIRALVQDTYIEDTHGIDRFQFTIEHRPEPLLRRLQRALPPLRVTVLRGLQHSGNAVAWLYYLFISLPLLAMLAAVLRKIRGDREACQLDVEFPKIMSTAMLCAAANLFILRDPIGGRIGDVAAPTAILGAWLLGVWISSRAASPLTAPRRRPRRGFPGTVSWRDYTSIPVLLRFCGAIAIVGLTWLSESTLYNFSARLDRSALLKGPSATVARAQTMLHSLSLSPPDLDLLPEGGLAPLVRYARECTSPADRILASWFLPEIYFFAGRSFAGGTMLFFGGHWSSPEDQHEILARLRDQSVPVVFNRHGEWDFMRTYPLIYNYLLENYRLAGELTSNEATFEIFVDRQRAPNGTWEVTGLPCFD